MAAPFVIGLVLIRLLPRVAAIFLGIVSAATPTFSAAYIAEALSHPESAADFVPQTLFTLSVVIAAVAAIPAYREIRRPEARAVAQGCAAGVLILTDRGHIPIEHVRPGDLILTHRNRWRPSSASSTSGSSRRSGYAAPATPTVSG